MARVIEAHSYIRHQGGGGSDPHLIRGSDGSAYVVKFQGNPQEGRREGARILANEYMASRIGAVIGAPCPEGVIINVDESFIQGANISYPSGRPPGGPQFGSRYAADSSGASFQRPTPEHFRQFRNLSQIPNMVILDTLTWNTDRKIDHIVFHGVTGGFRFWAVDYGHCLGVTQGWASLPSVPAATPLVAPVMCDLVTDRSWIEEAISLTERALTDAEIDSALRDVPASAWGISEADLAGLRTFAVHQRTGIRERVLSHLNQFPSLRS
jgi:hypothetical protein